MNEHNEVIVKWIKVLFICQIANVITTALGAVAALSTIVSLAARIVSIAAVVALFSLAPVHERYRKAALFNAIAVGGGIVSGLLKVELFGLALSVCSIVATYHELNAHAELTAPRDEKLSKRWHSLFYYEIVVGLLTGLAATVAIMVAAFAEMDQDTVVSITLAVTAFVSLILALVRVMYLRQTLTLYQE